MGVSIIGVSIIGQRRKKPQANEAVVDNNIIKNEILFMGVALLLWFAYL